MKNDGYKIRDQQGIYFITFAIVEWVDVFTRKEYAAIVIESLRYCIQHKGLKVHAWCLMSNHVHLIISTEKGNISDVLRDFKKFTSKAIIEAIENNKEESRKNWMLWIFKKAGEKNSRNNDYQFWRQDNHPVQLETIAFTLDKLNYLHNNPVKAVQKIITLELQEHFKLNIFLLRLLRSSYKQIQMQSGLSL
jgi:REP element-mobilizing transposase RayT